MKKKILMCLPLLFAMTLTSCGVDKATFIQKIDEKKETAKYTDYKTMVFSGSSSYSSDGTNSNSKIDKSTYSVTWVLGAPTFVAQDDNAKDPTTYLLVSTLSAQIVLSSSLVSTIEESDENISYSAGSNFSISYTEKDEDSGVTAKSSLTWNNDLLLTKLTAKSTGSDTKIDLTYNLSWSK